MTLPEAFAVLAADEDGGGSRGRAERAAASLAIYGCLQACARWGPAGISVSLREDAASDVISKWLSSGLPASARACQTEAVAAAYVRTAHKRACIDRMRKTAKDVLTGSGVVPEPSEPPATGLPDPELFDGAVDAIMEATVLPALDSEVVPRHRETMRTAIRDRLAIVRGRTTLAALARASLAAEGFEVGAGTLSTRMERLGRAQRHAVGKLQEASDRGDGGTSTALLVPMIEYLRQQKKAEVDP